MPYQSLILNLLAKGGVVKVLPQIKVGLDSKVHLAQCDEHHDVQNPIGSQMVELGFVVVKQSPQETMQGHGEPALVERNKETTYPAGGWGSQVLYGMIHSRAWVKGHRSPFLMRPSIMARVTDDGAHYAIFPIGG